MAETVRKGLAEDIPPLYVTLLLLYFIPVVSAGRMLFARMNIALSLV